MIASLVGVSETRFKQNGYSKLFQLLAKSSSHYVFSSGEDRSYDLLASNPDIELTTQMRDLFDSYQFKNVFYRFLPGIDEVKLIRVPKLDEPITFENFADLPNREMKDW